MSGFERFGEIRGEMGSNETGNGTGFRFKRLQTVTGGEMFGEAAMRV
jgi:hypothetical protein